MKNVAARNNSDVCDVFAEVVQVATAFGDIAVRHFALG